MEEFPQFWNKKQRSVPWRALVQAAVGRRYSRPACSAAASPQGSRLPLHPHESLFVADIEQPLPRRNAIYLAYFLPKELENFSSEVCEALNERFDVSVHRQGHAVDALQKLEYPAQSRSRRWLPDLVGHGLLLACSLLAHPALGH
jgi:hypothetical protein